METNETISVKLPVFEGPLDLLLRLIDINKVSIYDIPIVEITDQYLTYINKMDRIDLNSMAFPDRFTGNCQTKDSAWLTPPVPM